MVLLLVLPGLSGCDDVRGAVRAGHPDAARILHGATLVLDLPAPYSPPGCGDAP